VLEYEYTTLLIGSEYKLFLNQSLCLTYTTTHCYIHLVGQVNILLVFEEIILSRERESIFFTVLPLPSQEKVCVVSYSLEAFWFCYSSLKSPEKIKKIQQKKRQKSKTT
jgi:hypothetical protein